MLKVFQVKLPHLRVIWSTIAWISTASMISSGVRSMIGIPIKSLIAAIIVKTMLAI